MGINPYRMVSFVLREHTLEILTILGTEDGISKRRVTQLNFSVRNLLHTESCIVQIYRVTDLIVPVGSSETGASTTSSGSVAGVSG